MSIESSTSNECSSSSLSNCEDYFEIVKVRDHVGFYVVGKDSTRTWYPDILVHGKKPIQGTQFVSIDQAYSFYVAYGKKAGFDVRRGGEYKAVGFSDATTKYFHCTREGFLPNPKEKSGVKSLDVYIVKIGNVFEVTSLIEGHNHPFVAEKDMIFMKNSRNIGYTKQHFLYQVSNVDFGPTIGFRLMKQIHGGFDMVGVTVNDCKNQKKKISFTKINHNYRCITFASGLLADETVGAYIWLLKQFKEAFGKDPEVVVTDQDPSMKIAIVECFPDSRHRLCMWHIMMKLGTKVGATLCNRTDQILPEIFEREWECMINEFELGENKWLGDMFNLRESWIHVYLTDVHMAGLMRTTSRSESENHFFGKWTSSHLTLIEFLSHYDTVVDYQRMRCLLRISIVDFCKSEMKLHCSCNRYEAYGLLCRHAFYVLRMNNVKEFPKNYLHKRWLKNVKPSSFGRRRITGASDVVESEVLELYQIFESTIDRLVHNFDKLHIYKDKMKELLNQAEIDVPTILKVSSKAIISAMLGVVEPENVVIGNPNHSKVKVTAEELAKRRTCGLCGGKEGHNKRTCTNELASKKPKLQVALKEKASPKQQASPPRRSGLRSSTPK
ncbi:FAR1 DNA binding domain, zinc finger, SWIM-type, MULE transposase domain containing protein [Tanacetum coccineum]